MRQLLFVLTLLLMTAASPSRALPVLPSMTIPADTTRYGEDDEYDEDGSFQADSTRKPRDMVKGHNLINDVMEGRYMPEGETFSKGKSWMKNIYLQLGAGGQKIMPPSKDFEFGGMPTVQFGVGKLFNKWHSVRLLGHAAWGYTQQRDYKLNIYGLKAEYLYDLSSYFDGYNPTRKLNLSAILGVGGQYSKMHHESAMSGEVHMGLQLRCFTGPKAYVTLEPYVGLGTDQMDVSGKRNWRSTDIFYGISLNYIYYLRSNLTQESWKRLILERDTIYDQVSKDGRLESWQQPWFLQFTTGPSFMNSPELGMSETMGTEVALSGGKWLSPGMGIRATLFQRTNVWRKVRSDAVAATFNPEYTIDRHNAYLGFRVEAIINPFGFLKHFRWDRQWGVYVAAGFEKGWLQKTQSEPLSCSTFGWGGGINLWYQPTEGLKVFVEPRFMHNEYNIPYSNVDWYKRFSDNNVTVNFGFSIEQRDDRRFYPHNYEMEFVVDRQRTWTVGGALGMNFLQTEGGYTGGAGLSYNGQVFGIYHIDRTLGGRLGIEYAGLKRTNLTAYTDYNMDFPEEGNAPVERTGLWEHKYGLLLISPGAIVDLNHLMMHYRPQRLRLSAYAGPTLVMMLNYNSQISPLERIMENHTVVPNGDTKGKMSLGAHLGFKLEYHWKKHLSFYLSPTVYSLLSTKMPGVDFTGLKLMETINFGVQYSLGDAK